jgi:hypothetical protein
VEESKEAIEAAMMLGPGTTRERRAAKARACLLCKDSDERDNRTDNYRRLKADCTDHPFEDIGL